MRSVSVSDIIEVNGMQFYVDNCGFTAYQKAEYSEEPENYKYNPHGMAPSLEELAVDRMSH